MHSEIIKRWNKKVTNGDDVYILGDIGSRGYQNMHVELIAQLKGRKHLIIGNHDDIKDLRVQQQFVEIVQAKSLSVMANKEPYKLLLTHCPYMMWDGQHRGVIMLYGHLHNTLDEKLFQQYLAAYNKERPPKADNRENPCRAYSVCQCLWDYEPVTLEEILEKGDEKKR